MAQAARLNMRMHKELKLLLSDPPHGASFPDLSDCISTIDALIEGPEDTVYANGIFKVKIQIPERYPFQPPIVAFATPIYHPNIDNSGRICLDILNLPPKGAWQPSLNISTVLISIRLLLSEPNPDDGLMCELSREYKYNRQTFDFKAREMTDKYAKVKADDGSSSSSYPVKVSESGDIVLPAGSSLTQTEGIYNNQEDESGKRKAVIGYNGIKMSRKKLSLALPSAACEENKTPHSYAKKISLGLNQSFKEERDTTSFTKSDKGRLNRKLSLKPLAGESQLNNVSKSENSHLEEAAMHESIVVLDSDDSGEEEEKEKVVSSRSRLSLVRRGFKC